MPSHTEAERKRKRQTRIGRVKRVAKAPGRAMRRAVAGKPPTQVRVVTGEQKRQIAKRRVTAKARRTAALKAEAAGLRGTALVTGGAPTKPRQRTGTQRKVRKTVGRAPQIQSALKELERQKRARQKRIRELKR